jgi:hypothetical protein
LLLTALQDCGLLEFDDKKRPKSDEIISDCIDSTLLEAARKKKKFRSGGKLVRLVKEKAFLPHLGMNVTTDDITESSDEGDEGSG